MIQIGPAGNVSHDSISSLETIKKSGLDGQELAFVRSVYMDNDTATSIGRKAKKLGLFLSIHASYFVNLNSDEKAKASKKRILLACERAHYLGAKNVVFHAGYYKGMDPEETFRRIKKEIISMMNTLDKRGWKGVVLCPETTGKKSQFGSLSELLRLREEIGCGICVDFAHLLARDGTVDYKTVVEKLPESFHAHFSGIEYTEKGERRHLPIDKDAFIRLSDELKRHGKKATIICESPHTFEDALMMKKISR